MTNILFCVSLNFVDRSHGEPLFDTKGRDLKISWWLCGLTLSKQRSYLLIMMWRYLWCYIFAVN